MPHLPKGVAQYAADGCLVKPLLHQFLQDPGLEFSFNLCVERIGSRTPDGWFHSSTHPLMHEMELVTYLRRPSVKPAASLDYVGSVSTMNGIMWHSVIGAALDYFKVTVPFPPGPCVACGLPRPKRGLKTSTGQCDEHGAIDPATRSRGHLDRILDFKKEGLYGFDLKTIYHFGLSKVPDMDAAFFREKWPGYYAQAQDYMRMTGLRRYIVLFFSQGVPWEMREFHFDFDPVLAHQIETKYKAALRLAGVAA